MRVWGGSGGPQPSAVRGDKAKQDLEHCSWGTAGKSQESSQFLAGFCSSHSHRGKVKCLSNAKVSKKSNYVSTAKRKKVNFQDRRVECAYYCPHQLHA